MVITEKENAMDRRNFLKLSFGLGVLSILDIPGSLSVLHAADTGWSSNTQALPYAKDALEPYMSARTFEFHYGKHYQTYIDNTRKLISGTEFATLPLKDIILKSYGKTAHTAIFNNAAQSFNHEFFWSSMRPGGGGKPQGRIGHAIEKSFGSYAQFEKEFIEAAMTQFGSGWAWLVQDKSNLKVVKTANADTPLTQGWKPLFTLDVWEHAYYIDHQNRRGDYIRSFLDRLVNWDFAESNLV
jgi:Fe-Mn family superoxide dismutase